LTEISGEEEDWLEHHAAAPLGDASENSAAAKQLLARVLEELSPSARIVINLLEIDEKSVREISELTGWSQPMVKVRAFRARLEMKKILARITKDKYL
jgi:RNA polymerase sigma-70 factor (ECF subfamily)